MTTPDENPNKVTPYKPEGMPRPQPAPRSLNWPLGLAVVVIGGVLLARNLGYELFFLKVDNWWAFFILLAAIGPLQEAISIFRKEGFTVSVANALVSAGAIIFVALIFLLDLKFFTWWPVFVIFGGLYLMTNRSR